MSTTRHPIVLATFIVLATLGTLSSPAGAIETRPQLSFSPFGSLTKGSGIALDQSTGNVFVADSAANEIRVYDSGGGIPVGVPARLTGEQTPAKSFEFKFKGTPEPVGVAVDNACQQQGLTGAACTALDPSNGAIYVTDVIHSVVDKFVANAAHEYEYVCQFTGFGFVGLACLKNEPTVQGTPSAVTFSEPIGVTVDREGNIYIADFGSKSIYEFNSKDEQVIRISTAAQIGEPQDIAVDAKGDIFVRQYSGIGNGSNEWELVRSGFTGGVEAEIALHENTTGLTYNLASGRLFLGFGSSIEEYSEAGVPLLSFGSGVSGIAVNEAANHVYVVNGTSVNAYGPPRIVPTAVTGGVSNVTRVSATVEGAVNPESNTLTAGCEVQYGLTTGYGMSAPCSPANVGIGETSVPITATLTGLTANTTYHYRIVGTNSNGVGLPGVDGSVTTHAYEPTVMSESAPIIFPQRVVLAGQIDTNGVGASYHFAYGPTGAYGTSVPLTEQNIGVGANVQVSVALEGLAPGTTYHYALVATSSGGITVGPDQTFTTAAPPLPTVTTGEPVGVAQNTAVLTGSVNPNGVPTSYEFDLGTDTTYGSRISGQAGDGTEPVALELPLQGLAPGTLYHYRLVATNQYGTVYGIDRTLTTPAYPTALLVSPPTAPLIATPAFEPFSIGGASIPNDARSKTKHKTAKGKHRSARKAKKASHSDRTERRSRR